MNENDQFTGALCIKIGTLNRQNGGTLFLDEMGNLSMIFKQLLRQSRKEKLNGPTVQKIDLESKDYCSNK
jgi:DNA-binding NtrC family response regulator